MIVPDESSAKMMFSYPGADLTLRSCDSHIFLVPKLYIVNSSPELGKLVQDTLNSSNIADDETSHPVVQLSDTGTILNCLLTFIFPVSPVLPSTISEVMELLSVAQKYEMDSTIAHILAIARQDPSFTSPENAFYVYSLAQKHGLRQEALQAARHTLTFSMTIEDLEDKLDILQGATLYELWKYHKRVRSALASGLAEFRDLGAHGTLTGIRCARSTPSLIPHWLDMYIESIGRNPKLFNIAEFNTALGHHTRDKAKDRRCACASITSHTIRTFWTALTVVVDESIKKAESAQSLAQKEAKSQVGTMSSKLGSSPRKYLDVPSADIILRSADLVNFRVHKSALTMASPFFKDMFSLPQLPDGEVVDGLPVVQLSEDADLLSYLIPMLYPVRHVIPWFESKLLSLLAACQKYDMPSIQSSIRAHVHHRRSNYYGDGAFSIYAIASSKRLIPEMEKAAHLTLDYPMTLETLGEGLRLFEGKALHDLFCYRRRCRDNIVACLESFLEVRARPSKVWVGCPDAMRHSPGAGNVAKSTKNALPRWLCDVLTREKDRIRHGLTCSLDLSWSIRHEFFTALRAHAGCHFCLGVHLTEEGSKFCDALSWELYRACRKESVINNCQ